MKIGILTAYDAFNYGAILQAYALACNLTTMGHKVKFIKVQNELKVFKLFWLGERNNIKNFRDFSFIWKKYCLFRNVRKKFHPIPARKITLDMFDVVIIGSDELWNLKWPIINNIPLHANKIYYGSGIACKHIITYAISSGDSRWRDYKKFPDIIKSMGLLDKILVRDSNTEKNVFNLLGIHCEKVADPTLLIDVKNLYVRNNINFFEKYILVYAYSVEYKVKSYIEKYAKSKHYKIVSIGLKYDWANENIICNPLEFVLYFKNAEAVITSTFHGTIFSVLTHSKFITIPNNAKMWDLIKQLEIKEASISNECSYHDFKEKLEQIIDFEKIDENIEKIRSDSLKILNGYLG